MEKLIARIKRFTAGVPFYRWPIKFFKSRMERARSHKALKLKALRRFDRKNRVDFGGFIPSDVLGNEKVGGSAYEPSYPMPNLMKALKIKESDALLDIGCGKGYAMYCFGELPFARIDGLEYNHKLAEIARANFAKLFPNNDRFHVFEGDAALWTDYDRYDYVYLYNPFRAEIVEQVCDSLLESLRRAPRELTIIYQAPFHWKVMDAKGFRPALSMDGTLVLKPKDSVRLAG